MMKLLEHSRRPDISFNRNGVIRITARVAKMLSLRPGDALNISIKDEEYLLHVAPKHIASGRHEATCYPTNKGGSNYCANSAKLCKALLRSLKLQCANVSFMVGEPISIENRVYVPIITMRPL